LHVTALNIHALFGIDTPCFSDMSARTGKLKPSLRTISIASVPS